jgi:hypothetical protein
MCLCISAIVCLPIYLYLSVWLPICLSASLPVTWLCITLPLYAYFRHQYVPCKTVAFPNQTHALYELVQTFHSCVHLPYMDQLAAALIGTCVVFFLTLTHSVLAVLIPHSAHPPLTISTAFSLLKVDFPLMKI